MAAAENDARFKIKKHTTERGFSRDEFADLYGQKCSLQDSSLATQAAIWLGVDVDLEGKEVNNRMHLSQNMVRQLLPILQRFVETGSVGEEDDNG